MPELPEVQTIVDQLKEKLVGKKIAGVDVRLAKMWEGDKNAVIGATITDVKRRAKMVIIKLNNGYNLLVHLKMTGQLVYGEGSRDQALGSSDTISFPNPIPFAGSTLPGKTTHVIFDLEDPSIGSGRAHARLFFNDMRQFGWIRIIDNKQLTINNERLGPEPFANAQGKPSDFTPEYLLKICSNWGRPIKLLLMEQSKISGIGNIYANEALFCAGISPMHRGRDLVKDHPEKIKKLWECIRNSLELGIKYGGSSVADEAYVNAYGLPGKMQEHFVVYQKDGQECPRCGKTITVSRLGGRGTFFCPKCQT